MIVCPSSSSCVQRYAPPTKSSLLIEGNDASVDLTYTRGHVVMQQTMHRILPTVAEASVEEVHGQRPGERLCLGDRGQGRGPVDEVTVESETTLFSLG